MVEATKRIQSAYQSYRERQAAGKWTWTYCISSLPEVRSTLERHASPKTFLHAMELPWTSDSNLKSSDMKPNSKFVRRHLNGVMQIGPVRVWRWNSPLTSIDGYFLCFCGIQALGVIGRSCQ